MKPRPLAGEVGSEAALPAVRGAYSAQHLPELDGMRAFAILAVMFFHARGIAEPHSQLERAVYRISEAGWVGVDLFFVLSGYLITGILVDSKASDGYFKNFFARRALRILPLYYLVVLLVFMGIRWGMLVGPPAAEPYHWLYLQNWLRLYGDAYRVETITHFWSLAIEEQFYVIWPFLVWLCARRSLAWLCAGVVVAATVARLCVALDGSLAPRLIYFLTPMRLDSLALGGLIATLMRSPGGALRLTRWWLPAALLSVAAMVSIAVAEGRYLPEDAPTVVWGCLANELLFAALLVACISMPNGWLGTLLRRPVLRGIGRISYGAYVFHLPVMVLLAKVWPFARRLAFFPNQLLWWLTTFTLTLALSALSFRVFESRFLRLKRHFGPS